MLRQLGKCVIAIAVDSDKTNDMIREASDLLHYYDVLVNEQLERLSQGRRRRCAFRTTRS
jgi:phosphoribosyl-ATP pyrophosphohydrolase